MSDWKPKTKTSVDVTKLDLTGEEGFVLSRIDGSTSVTNLSHVTGMTADRVDAILGKLMKAGVLEGPSSAPAPARATSATKRTPSSSTANVNATVVEAPVFDATLEMSRLDVPDDGDVFGTGLTSSEQREIEAEAFASDEDFLGEATLEGEAGSDGERNVASHEGPTDENKSGDADQDDDEEETSAKVDDALAKAEEDEEKKGEEELERATSNYRRLYAEQLADKQVDDRVHLAQTESGDVLMALCFDAQARVVIAVVENVNSGLDHARLIATHHRTGTGLSALAKNQAFLRDTQTQRALLKNPQLPDTLFKLIMAPKRMADTYRLSLSRELTERTKTAARNLFRKKFTEGTAEERVALIYQCEGRCLNLLLGVTIDARTASLMCQKQMLSTLLIQNLCRFPSTPPPVLVHMAKQQLVRRTPSLKQLVVRHPNAPTGLKRGDKA
jgi:hypothetical protein